jgi:hypothetical protein
VIPAITSKYQQTEFFKISISYHTASIILCGFV